MSPRPSLRAAIDAKCKECIFDPVEDGTWRQQVEACLARACPLYPVRPKAQDGVKKAPKRGQEQRQAGRATSDP